MFLVFSSLGGRGTEHVAAVCGVGVQKQKCSSGFSKEGPCWRAKMAALAGGG
jgi:hypothetical protein